MMVLANQLITERGGYEDARGEVGVFVDGEAVALGDGGGVEGLEESGVGILGVFPLVEGGR